MKMSIWKRVRPWIIPAVVTLLFCLVLRFVVLIGYVPSASMEPTIKQDSLIFGWRIHNSPEVGDIVVFEKDGVLQVKRVAAGPCNIVDYSSLEYMDSLPIPERNMTVVTVPAGCYFLLGDNVQNSLDSRYWDNPFISEDQIVAIIPQHVN